MCWTLPPLNFYAHPKSCRENTTLKSRMLGPGCTAASRLDDFMQVNYSLKKKKKKKAPATLLPGGVATEISGSDPLLALLPPALFSVHTTRLLLGFPARWGTEAVLDSKLSISAQHQPGPSPSSSSKCHLRSFEWRLNLALHTGGADPT